MTAAEVQRVSASCLLFSYLFKLGVAFWAARTPVKHQQLLDDRDHSGLIQRHRCVATTGGVRGEGGGEGGSVGGCQEEQPMLLMCKSRVNRSQLLSRFHEHACSQVISF